MFFPAGNIKLQWEEPWFFKVRTRGLWGWALPVGVFVGFTTLVAALLAQENASAGETKHSIAIVIIVPAVIGLFFTSFLELPHLRRAVTVTDRGLTCGGAYSLYYAPGIHLVTRGSWSLREIKEVRLVRAGEGENRFGHGLLVVVPKYASRAVLAVSTDVPLERLAATLHEVGIAVTLTNWHPPAPTPDGSADAMGRSRDL